MFVKENRNKDNEIISYRLFASGKDPATNKNKVYAKTLKIPYGISAKDRKLLLEKTKIKWASEVDKMSQGIYQSIDKDIMFVDYADRWLKNILVQNPQAYTYYNGQVDRLKIINEFFKNYKLKNINTIVVKEFLEYLCSRRKVSYSVSVVKSLDEILKRQPKSMTLLSEEIGIKPTTFREARKIGKKIAYETAKAITSYFNVPMQDYFKVDKREEPYALATNRGIKTTLTMILGDASRDELIPKNYADKDHLKFKISGREKVEAYYEEDELKEFVQNMQKETDIRKKTMLALFVYLGLRRAELFGLHWHSIDFDKNIISIEQNTTYTKTFYIQDGPTKNKRSKREITMPTGLVEILKEYKEYWLDQQSIFGEMWGNSDRLFIRECGKSMNPCTAYQWVSKFEKAHNLKHVSPHKISHTAITHQIRNGILPTVVADRSGHDVRVAMEIYNHTLKSQDKEASQVYNEFLNFSK